MPKRDPPARRYVAGLPGVGPGMLDTLELIYGPFVVDTVRTDPHFYAEFQPGRDRLIVNPSFVERILAKNPSSRIDGVPARDVLPLLLAHEVLGHGSGASEAESERIGRAFVRATRNPELPLTRGEPAAMRRIMDILRGINGD